MSERGNRSEQITLFEEKKSDLHQKPKSECPTLIRAVAGSLFGCLLFLMTGFSYLSKIVAAGQQCTLVDIDKVLSGQRGTGRCNHVDWSFCVYADRAREGVNSNRCGGKDIWPNEFQIETLH